MIWDRAMETMDRQRLRRVQEMRLSWTLNWARERVPFYQDRIDRNISSANRDPFAYLEDIPFTTKKDLREHYPLGMFAVPRHELRRIHASSGTGGKPTMVGYTARDLSMWAEVVARSLTAAGARPGDMLHNAYGYGLFTGGLGLHAGAERLGLTVIPVSGGGSERQVELLSDLRPEGLACTPSYALNLAETGLRMGMDPTAFGLKFAILGAEPWTEAMRQRIESALNVSAVDIYGLSEITGPGVAIECDQAKDGLHIFEDFFYVEIVDPKTGNPVPVGTLGELVLTTLAKEAMPMVRYRTGDLVTLIEEPCTCGRTHRKMSRVVGRTDDMLVVRGVNVFPSEIERVMLNLSTELEPNYQLAWEDGPMPRLVLEVESGSVSHLDPEWIARRLREALRVSLEVRLLAPGTLVRAAGKAVRVVDRRTTERK